MNCQEALSLLYDIIDKEASEIDAKQVQEHLSRCRHCSELYRVEQSVNALLKAKMQQSSPAPCVDVLKSRVLNELDAIDEDFRSQPDKSSGEPKTRSFLRLGRYLAMAAALVVVVATIYYATRVGEHQEVFIPLEQSHWAAVENIDSFRNNATTMTVMNSLNRQLDYVLEPEVRNFIMIGGRHELIDGNQLIHFVYHNDDKLVSVFVADQHYLTIPTELRDAAVTRHGITFFDHNCRGCRLVYHQAGNVVVVTATSDRDIELLDFIPGHRVI